MIVLCEYGNFFFITDEHWSLYKVNGLYMFRNLRLLTQDSMLKVGGVYKPNIVGAVTKKCEFKTIAEMTESLPRLYPEYFI